MVSVSRTCLFILKVQQEVGFHRELLACLDLAVIVLILGWRFKPIINWGVGDTIIILTLEM